MCRVALSLAFVVARVLQTSVLYNYNYEITIPLKLSCLSHEALHNCTHCYVCMYVFLKWISVALRNPSEVYGLCMP